MLHISVDGFQPSHWSRYLSVKLHANKAAKEALRAPGCLASGVFKQGSTFFIYTVWEGKVQMKFYETSPLRASLHDELSQDVDRIDTHSFVSRTTPSQQQLRDLWNAARYVMAA